MRLPATSAPTAATAAATKKAMRLPLTNASRAESWMSSPADRGIRPDRTASSDTPNALPIESSINSRGPAGIGRSLIRSAILELNPDASTDPMMAMPNAPPTSRVTSLTADPTPDFESGNDDTIMPLAGAISVAMPVDITQRKIARCQ